MSSSNFPVAIVLTSVVLPAFYNPTKAISNSFPKNSSLIQFINLENIDKIYIIILHHYINDYYSESESELL